MIATRSARRLRLVHVVGGEEDGLAEVAEPGDHLPGLAAGGGIEAGRRLVEEEQLGVADQRDADVEAALLAARERPARSSAFSARPTSSIVSSTGRGCGSSRRTARASRGRSAAAPSGTPEGRCRPARARPGRRFAGSVPSTRTSPAAALAVALEDLGRWWSCRRRWARGRRRSRPRLDLEVDAPHGLEVPVGDAEAADAYDRLGHARIMNGLRCRPAPPRARHRSCSTACGCHGRACRGCRGLTPAPRGRR